MPGCTAIVPERQRTPRAHHRSLARPTPRFPSTSFWSAGATDARRAPRSCGPSIVGRGACGLPVVACDCHPRPRTAGFAALVDRITHPDNLVRARAGGGRAWAAAWPVALGSAELEGRIRPSAKICPQRKPPCTTAVSGGPDRWTGFVLVLLRSPRSGAVPPPRCLMPAPRTAHHLTHSRRRARQRPVLSGRSPSPGAPVGRPPL